MKTEGTIDITVTDNGRKSEMREFESGATRDTDEGKADYEGFLSPLVIQRYGEYMMLHQVQADGELRESDNWQKGMPKDAYIKSAWRHFMDWWMEHRGYPSREGLEDALCALMFGVMGYLHEHLKEKAVVGIDVTTHGDSETVLLENEERTCKTCLFVDEYGFDCFKERGCRPRNLRRWEPKV